MIEKSQWKKREIKTCQSVWPIEEGSPTEQNQRWQSNKTANVYNMTQENPFPLMKMDNELCCLIRVNLGWIFADV